MIGETYDHWKSTDQQEEQSMSDNDNISTEELVANRKERLNSVAPGLVAVMEQVFPGDVHNALKCTTCSKPITANSFRDRLSAKEHAISGMCQECQDSVFAEPEEEEEEDNQL